MDNQQINKLISIFLGLSILVSSIIFVFSDYLVGFYNSNQKNNLSNENQNTQNESSFVSQSPFVESPQNITNYYPTISLNEEFKPSGNLTDDFASFAAREIVINNPNGPQINEDGNPSIEVPNIENLSDKFATIVSPQLKITEWEKDVNEINNQLKISNRNSTSTIISYFENFGNLINKYFNSEKLNNLFNSKVPLEIAAETGEQIFNEAINDFLKLETPADVKNLQQSIIKILVYQRNLFKEGKKINNDPLYFNLVLENKQEEINNALNEFENNLNIAAKKYSYLNNYQKNISWLDKILEKTIFVPKVHALFGFLSIVFDPAVVGELVRQALNYLKDNLKKIALEILKDQLIHRLVNETIKWVQGGGTPQFVTNWKRFFEESGSRAAGLVIQKTLPLVCSPFRPLLQASFETVSTYEDSVTCTLGNIERNLVQFYNDFKYGGWITYGAMLRPENNFYGQILMTQDKILEEAAKEQEAAQSDAEASKGFLPTKVCVKEKTSTMPLSQAATLPQVPGVTVRCGPINEPGLAVTKGTCIVKTCEQYENKTPGALIGDITSQAIGNSPIARIVNAQDIVALVSALVNSGLMRLIKAGQQGLAGVLTGKAAKDNSNLPPGAITDPTNPCYGEVPGTPKYNDCIGNTTGNYFIDTKDEQAELLTQAQDILKQLKNNLDANNQFLALASSTKLKLDQLGGCSNNIAICPNLSQQACNLINTITGLENTTTNEIPLINSDIANIESIINELYNSSNININRLTEINEIIKRYQNPGANAPQERLNNLQNLDEAINNNLYNTPQCQATLPSL